MGIDVDSLTSFLFSHSFFEKMSHSFVSTLPELAVLFFDPVMERHRLEAHDYHAATTVRSMQSFSDVHILDFVKLPLKCRENYETALGLVLQSHLKSIFQSLLFYSLGTGPHNVIAVKLYIGHAVQAGRVCPQILSPPWYHVWDLYM